MELSEFTLKIILLFIPGIISFMIVDSLTIHKEAKVHKILIHSLVLGFLCYFSYYLIVSAIKIFIDIDIGFSFLEILINSDATLNFKEIAFVTVLSILIGLMFVALINHTALYRIARRLKISKKFGDIDVWSYIMNSKVPAWVVIRDIENDLMYEGWVKVFSDSTEEDELFLTNVKVYRNSTAKELYAVPGLYLPRKREHLVVEFPSFKIQQI